MTPAELEAHVVVRWRHNPCHLGGQGGEEIQVAT